LIKKLGKLTNKEIAMIREKIDLVNYWANPLYTSLSFLTNPKMVL
jgi:hypothetical protein